MYKCYGGLKKRKISWGHINRFHLLNIYKFIIFPCVTKWSKAPAWKARGRWFDYRRRQIFAFWISFSLSSRCSRLGKSTQMKSSTTFIHSNRCIEINLRNNINNLFFYGGIEVKPIYKLQNKRGGLYKVFKSVWILYLHRKINY